jgi:hypothetical protein
MNKDLFSRIVNADEDEKFQEIFASLNLIGYEILDKLECNTDTKNRLVKYTALAYSFQSPMLKIHRDDRIKNKIAILRKVGIDTESDFIKSIINNEDENVRNYISWWLETNSDPLESAYFATRDAYSFQLRFATEGFNVTFMGDNAKDMVKAIKSAGKEADSMAKALFNARKMLEQIESDEKEIQRRYDFLDGIIKKEVPEFFGVHKNRQEKNAHKWRKQYESNKKQSYTALS